MYGDQDQINAAGDVPVIAESNEQPQNPLPQDDNAVEQPPANNAEGGNSAHMSDRSQEDGYVMINNQPVNQEFNPNPVAPAGLDGLAKPQFGPSAAQIINPNAQVIQKV